MLDKSTPPKEKYFTFRVEAKLKEEFQQATRNLGRSSASVLRSLMRRYIKRRKAKSSIEKAKHQSLIIAEAARRSDSDEARVMQALEEDLYYFNEQ